MLALKDHIYDLIAKVQPRVYFQRAPSKDAKGQKLKLPYIVFRLPDVSSDIQVIGDYDLEIDIFGNTTEKEINDMANTLDGILNRYKYGDANLKLSVYRDSPHRINNLPDPDKTIKRTKLKYIVKAYIKNDVYVPPVQVDSGIEWEYF